MNLSTTLRRFAAAACAACIALAAVAGTLREACFSLNPRMHCANCEKKIKTNLRFERGVKSIDTSIADQRVTIVYDSDKTDPQKLAKAFGKIGYKATPLPTDSVAR